MLGCLQVAEAMAAAAAAATAPPCPSVWTATRIILGTGCAAHSGGGGLHLELQKEIDGVLVWKMCQTILHVVFRLRTAMLFS